MNGHASRYLFFLFSVNKIVLFNGITAAYKLEER